MSKSKFFYFLLAFFAGFVNLGYEMFAARSLAPFYGVSIVVWSAVISSLLVAISTGSIIGGKLSESHKENYIYIPLISSIVMLNIFFIIQFNEMLFLFFS